MLTATIVDAWLKMMTLSLHVTIKRFPDFYDISYIRLNKVTVGQQDNKNRTRRKKRWTQTEQKRGGMALIRRKKMYRLKQLKMRGREQPAIPHAAVYMKSNASPGSGGN